MRTDIAADLRATLERLHDEQEREGYSWSPEDCRTRLNEATRMGRYIIQQAPASSWECDQDAFETLLQAGRQLSDAIDQACRELGWLQTFEEAASMIGYDAAHHAAVRGDFNKFEANIQGVKS